MYPLMMVLLFLILTFAMLFARKGNYTFAVAGFFLLLILSVCWLIYHMSDAININL